MQMVNDLSVGDTILMTRLAQENVQTDFMYKKDGEDGFWLKVEKIG